MGIYWLEITREVMSLKHYLTCYIPCPQEKFQNLTFYSQKEGVPEIKSPQQTG